MPKISKRLYQILSKEVVQLLKDYDVFRQVIAKEALLEIDIKDKIAEEELIWENKIKAAKEKIKGLTPVAIERNSDIVSLGSKVLLKGEGGSRVVIIDGAWHIDKHLIINYQSPLGKKLLGRKVGEIVDNQKIIEISPWY